MTMLRMNADRTITFLSLQTFSSSSWKSDWNFSPLAVEEVLLVVVGAAVLADASGLYRNNVLLDAGAVVVIAHQRGDVARQDSPLIVASMLI